MGYNSFVIFIFLIKCYFVCCEEPHAIFDQILDDVKYDKRTRPGSLTDEQTVVKINMNVNDVSSVDELDMEFSIDIYLRQSWNDHRLRSNLFNKTLHLSEQCLSKLWVPDLYVSNSKNGRFHDITVPNILLRISPDGTVFFSQRLTLKVACFLLLYKFPMDNQTCRIQMESYSHTENEIKFVWTGAGYNAIQKDEDISLPEFTIQHLNSGVCSMHYITGSFTCIYAEVHFQRAIGYYLIQTYVPSVLVVILSWVSFWIDMHAVPARITLGLLTVLTMTTQASAITQTLPRVSYIKAIDVWIAICLLFVFGALVEYSVVNVLARGVQGKILRRMTIKPGHGRYNQGLSRSSLAWLTRGEMSTNFLRAVSSQQSIASNLSDLENGVSSNGSKNSENPIYEDKTDEEKQSPCSNQNSCFKNLWAKDKALYVDKLSRVMFPGVFILFNIMYWIVYLYIMH